MTNEELAEIIERTARATEGPWYFIDIDGYDISSEYTGKETAKTYHYTDAAFIAHARTDIPKLLAEIERLRELLNKAFEYGTSSDAYRDEKVIEELYEYLYGGDDE